MTTSIDNAMTLWMWPMSSAKLVSDWFETISSAHRVIEARTPVIAAAWANPFLADHRELTRMVSEKADAFGASHRSITTARGVVRRASEANARAFGRLSGGQWLGPVEWTRIFERNLQIAATLATLPTAALAPVHAKATENAVRLGSKQNK